MVWVPALPASEGIVAGHEKVPSGAAVVLQRRSFEPPLPVRYFTLTVSPALNPAPEIVTVVLAGPRVGEMVIESLVVMRSIDSAAMSVNHSLPSGPDVVANSEPTSGP